MTFLPSPVDDTKGQQLVESSAGVSALEQEQSKSALSLKPVFNLLRRLDRCRQLYPALKPTFDGMADNG